MCCSGRLSDPISPRRSTYHRDEILSSALALDDRQHGALAKAKQTIRQTGDRCISRRGLLTTGRARGNAKDMFRNADKSSNARSTHLSPKLGICSSAFWHIKLLEVCMPRQARKRSH